MLPDDDPSRDIAIAQPEIDSRLPHVAVVGDIYTILITGEQTSGRYALIDMFVPPGGGPPPHRHDFEEMFHILEGEIELLFRGANSTAKVGTIVNIPANAPHTFKNASDKPVRILCLVSPAGQEQFFLEVGDRVPTRTGPLPDLDDDARAERVAKLMTLAPKYKNEILPPQ